MIPLSLIEGQRQAQADIATLAYRDLLSVWRAVDLTDARAATAVLLPAVRDVTAAYGDLSAFAAADFYDTARSASGVPGRFTARAAPVAPAGQVDAMVRWAAGPIWAADPRTGAALVRLAGGTQRLIRRTERDTIYGSRLRDPAQVRELVDDLNRRFSAWVRVPAANACDFCLMLASRGDVYRTRESALSVVGRGGGPRRSGPRGFVPAGRRTGGGRPLGERYHDHCRCSTVPVWSHDDVPEINKQLHDEWQQATAGQRDQLGVWREHVARTRPHQHAPRP